MKHLKQFFKRLVAIRRNEVDARIFLEELLENSGRFKAVAVVIQYHDGTFDTDWSKMTTEQLAMACIVLDEQMRRCVIDRGQP